MPRPLKICLLIALTLLVFTLGKWLILDSLWGDRQSGRYRNSDDITGMTER